MSKAETLLRVTGFGIAMLANTYMFLDPKLNENKNKNKNKNKKESAFPEKPKNLGKDQ